MYMYSFENSRCRIAAQFDSDALRWLKREYGDGPVVQTNPIKKLEVVLTKPMRTGIQMASLTAKQGS